MHTNRTYYTTSVVFVNRSRTGIKIANNKNKQTRKGDTVLPYPWKTNNDEYADTSTGMVYLVNSPSENTLAVSVRWLMWKYVPISGTELIIVRSRRIPVLRVYKYWIMSFDNQIMSILYIVGLCTSALKMHSNSRMPCDCNSIQIFEKIAWIG